MINADPLHWRLKPGIGLGNLKFGAKTGELALERLYGPIKAVRAHHQMKSSDAADALRQLGFSDADIASALAARDAHSAAEQRDTTIILDSGLITELSDGYLLELTADFRADSLNFENQRVFRGAPRNIIHHFSAYLDEIPLIKDEEVVFSRSYIFLFQFLIKDSSGIISDGDLNERSITWRASPRIGGVDLEEYEALNI